MAKKKKSEQVDELSKLNMLKAESFLYKTILGLGLGITFFIQICTKDTFQITLNWNTFMIIYGCCNLAYCYSFNFFENVRNVK